MSTHKSGLIPKGCAREKVGRKRHETVWKKILTRFYLRNYQAYGLLSSDLFYVADELHQL